MNQLPVLKKNNFITKIIYILKSFFNKKKPYRNSPENFSSTFINDIKITVDSEIIALKSKLENGEIEALDLTDLQIDKLQKIYDEEICVKQNILNTLMKRVIKPALFTYKLATSVVISTTAANY